MPPRSSVLPSTRPRLPESLIFTKSLAVEMSLPPNSPPQVFWWKNLKSNEEALSEIPATSVKLVPVTGKYRITANLATRVIDALVLNADGSGLATLSDDGHGAVYFIGYGIGSPAAVNEPGWTTEKGVCVPESAPGIYTMTAQAGLEGSTTLGQRFRVSGWSGKFFRNRGWDGLGAFTLAPGAEAFFSIAGNGNIEIASGVTLEEGATYRLTLDVTAGKDNPVLSLVKK